MDEVGFRIPWAGFRIGRTGFRIPEPRIPDSNFADRKKVGFLLRFHKASAGYRVPCFFLFFFFFFPKVTLQFVYFFLSLRDK